MSISSAIFSFSHAHPRLPKLSFPPLLFQRLRPLLCLHFLSIFSASLLAHIFILSARQASFSVV